MATTADDWTWIKSLIAITEEGNISVDLVAQTLENLNIHLTGAETIPIDLVAQTIGNLAVDIKAATIGNIPMNINEQGVGDINIDLKTQTIDRLVIRDNDGGIESSDSGAKIVTKGTERSIHLVSGKGCLRWAIYSVTAANDSHKIKPIIEIDGTDMHPKWNFYAMDIHGFDKTTRPWQLIEYAIDGECRAIFYAEKGIVFDTSVDFRAEEIIGTTDQHVNVWYFCQLIPP